MSLGKAGRLSLDEECVRNDELRFIVGCRGRCWGEEEEEVGGICGAAWAMHEGNEQL